MATDYFADLKKQPYPLFKAPKPYSFDLNEDMIQVLRKEFNAEAVTKQMEAAIAGKTGEEAQSAAEAFLKDAGAKWMTKTIQMANEYSDRTIEMVMETVDRQGKQFMIFPLLLQRYIEIGYLGTQETLKISIILNNKDELAYRIPKCTMYKQIAAKSGEEFAKQMTCKAYCQSALSVVQTQCDVDVKISQPRVTAKDGFCEFDLRKL
jgi:hypothetical protein